MEMPEFPCGTFYMQSVCLTMKLKAYPKNIAEDLGEVTAPDIAQAVRLQALLDVC